MFNRQRLTGLNPALLATGYPLSPHTHRKVRDKAIDGLLPRRRADERLSGFRSRSDRRDRRGARVNEADRFVETRRRVHSKAPIEICNALPVREESHVVMNTTVVLVEIPESMNTPISHEQRRIDVLANITGKEVGP